MPIKKLNFIGNTANKIKCSFLVHIISLIMKQALPLDMDIYRTYGESKQTGKTH